MKFLRSHWEIALLAAALLAFFGGLAITRYTSHVSSSVSQEKNELVTYRNELSLLPDLQQLDVGSQSGNIDSVVTKYSALADNSALQSVDTPNRISLWMTRTVKRNSAKDRPDINGFNDLSKKTMSTTTTSLKTFQKLLEYNPVLDFEEFDLESGDTKDRITSARSALRNIRSELDSQQSQVDKEVYESLMSELDKLDTAVSGLAAQNDLDGWKQQTAASQQTIVTTLGDYFDRNRKTLAKQSITINSYLSIYQ